MFGFKQAINMLAEVSTAIRRDNTDCSVFGDLDFHTRPRLPDGADGSGDIGLGGVRGFVTYPRAQ